MFRRFTEDARNVVVDAVACARRSGHQRVGPEHLLLAVASGATPAAEALRGLGISPESVERSLARPVPGLFESVDEAALAAIGIDLHAVRARVEAEFRSRPAVARRERHIPFTTSAKKCLEQSLREALARRDRHIGVEHIALALTSMAEGPIPPLLSALGTSTSQVRSAVLNRYRKAG